MFRAATLADFYEVAGSANAFAKLALGDVNKEAQLSVINSSICLTAVEYNGNVSAVFGIFVQSMTDDMGLVWMIAKEKQPYQRQILKQREKFLCIIPEHINSLVAETTSATTQRFARFMGFKKSDKGIYYWRRK